MIQESDLAKAASHLVRAETEYRAIKSYYDSMPADPDFDLGLSLSWNWGSATNGYKETRFRVAKALREELRIHIHQAVDSAEKELFAAQRALKQAA